MIRPLRAGDIDACAALLARLPEWFGIASANAAYVESLSRLTAFAAVPDGQVVGFLALEEKAPGSVEITVMAVERELHRRGFGSLLLAAAEQWCIETDTRWLHVKTRGPSTFDEHYEATRRFYWACGFDVLYESLTEWGPANAALVLVKRLPGPATDEWS